MFRCDYIDLVKGFCIIWVVWWHTWHPKILDPYYHVPLFFFVSGFFIKDSNFLDYVYRRFRQLIVPLVFFFLLYYPLWMVTYLWDHRTLSGFDWCAVRYMFDSSSTEFLTWNGPLWFLLVLFCINILVFAIRKTKYSKPIYVILILFSFFFFDFFYKRPWLEYIVYIGYYTLGILAGKKLIYYLSDNRARIFILSLFATLYVILNFIGNSISGSVFHGLVYTCSVVCFSMGTIALFSYFDSSKILSVFRFFGKNSLIVLGLHWWLTTAFFSRMFKVIFDYNVPVWAGFVDTVLTLVVIAAFVPLMNRYCSFFMGKNIKDLSLIHI